ncbi:NB-ARC domain-containing protein [Tautonia rosea]|uniref:NB-ARC domain-containing protein n=1 Tax=Tautonia rosea TaxID=2728037 RepID=UPI0014743307|nr:NB-ARC domain-containing protein [Tautonia rosea]
MGDRNITVQGDADGAVLSTGDHHYNAPVTNIYCKSPNFQSTPTLGRGPFLLPNCYVERSESLASLKERILGSGAGPSGVLAITAIRGLGGAGKSILANAFAHDPEVRDRFRDGILWVELGQDPDLLEHLRRWVGRLSINTNLPTTLEAATDDLRWLLGDRAVLIVVDNAWKAEHVRPFLVGCEGSQVLVTTRRASVADEISASVISLEGMTPEEAIRFLAKRLGQEHVDGARLDGALPVAEAVGYLPLALDLVASRVSKGITWANLHEALERECAQLEALDPLERRIEACIRLGLDALDATHPWAREAFLAFGILPDEATITAPMTATFWGVEPVEADRRLEFLEDFALLTTAPKICVGDDKWRSYRLHDLIHDYAKSLLGQQLGTPKKTPFAIAHADLLKRYQKRCTHQAGGSGRSKPWHTLPDDGYIHDHLTWHLKQAGRIDEIHSLLAEETAEGRNGWFEACDVLERVDSFLADVQRAWELADCAVRESTSPIHFERQCRYALIRASIVSLANNIPIPHLVAIAENRTWPVAKLLAFVRHIRNIVRRAEAAVALVPHLDRDGRLEVLNAALTGTYHVSVDGEEVEAFALLAPYLDSSQLDESLEIARRIVDSGTKNDLFAVLAPYLNRNQLNKSLAIVQGSAGSACRAQTLETLASYMDGDGRNEGSGVAPAGTSSIRNDAERVAVDRTFPLNATGDHPHGFTGTLPEISKPIGDAANLREVFSLLQSTLSGNQTRHRLSATLERAGVIVEESVRDAEYWAARCRELGRDQLEEMMGSVYRYGDVGHIISNEASYALLLEHDQRREMLASALTSTLDFRLWGQGRAEALARLAPHLDYDQFGTAMRIARSIDNSDHRSLALAALAPRLSTLPHDQLLPLWSESLHDLALNGRAELCSDLIMLTPVVNKLMGPEGLQKIAVLIQKVGKWWM